MSNKPENPPAFPRALASEAFGAGHEILDYGEAGMTLRDYFAANALNGMIAGSQGLAITTEEFANQSYSLADAMLKARQS